MNVAAQFLPAFFPKVRVAMNRYRQSGKRCFQQQGAQSTKEQRPLPRITIKFRHVISHFAFSQNCELLISGLSNAMEMVFDFIFLN